MESCRKRLEEELSCSICLQYFKEPVTLDCGHNFCHTCITNYWGRSPTDTTCPQCREVQVKRLKPNMHLGKLTEISKDMNHLLKHCFVSMEEAANGYKDQISGSLEFLRKEKENIVLYKAKHKEEGQDLLEQMQVERQKATAAFGDLCQFLEDQKKLLLAEMDEMEEEIKRRQNDYQISISAVLSSLDSLIQELEEKLKLSASELVEQNVRNVLDRCPKEPFKNPVAFPVSLKWKAHNFSDISPFLEGLMKPFQDSLKEGLQLQKANVTLDPDTAHPQIILSKDCKNVSCGPHQALPDNPERFDMWTFVLGNERMTSGRHFWEVTVGSEEDWSVGVTRKDVKRKGNFDFCPCEGIWHLGMWKGTYNISTHPGYTTLPLDQKLKKIRVILNCAGGRVAFFDADTGIHLYTYSDASLPRETLLPFFYVMDGATLTLSP